MNPDVNRPTSRALPASRKASAGPLIAERPPRFQSQPLPTPRPALRKVTLAQRATALLFVLFVAVLAWQREGATATRPVVEPRITEDDARLAAEAAAAGRTLPLPTAPPSLEDDAMRGFLRAGFLVARTQGETSIFPPTPPKGSTPPPGYPTDWTVSEALRVSKGDDLRFAADAPLLLSPAAARASAWLARRAGDSPARWTQLYATVQAACLGILLVAGFGLFDRMTGRSGCIDIAAMLAISALALGIRALAPGAPPENLTLSVIPAAAVALAALFLLRPGPGLIAGLACAVLAALAIASGLERPWAARLPVSLLAALVGIPAIAFAWINTWKHRMLLATILWTVGIAIMLWVAADQSIARSLAAGLVLGIALPRMFTGINMVVGIAVSSAFSAVVILFMVLGAVTDIRLAMLALPLQLLLLGLGWTLWATERSKSAILSFSVAGYWVFAGAAGVAPGAAILATLALLVLLAIARYVPEWFYGLGIALGVLLQPLFVLLLLPALLRGQWRAFLTGLAFVLPALAALPLLCTSEQVVAWGAELGRQFHVAPLALTLLVIGLVTSRRELTTPLLGAETLVLATAILVSTGWESESLGALIALLMMVAFGLVRHALKGGAKSFATMLLLGAAVALFFGKAGIALDVTQLLVIIAAALAPNGASGLAIQADDFDARGGIRRLPDVSLHRPLGAHGA